MKSKFKRRAPIAPAALTLSLCDSRAAGRPARILAHVALLAAAGIVAPQPACAALVESSWIGGDIASVWENAARWSAGIPNNAGTTTYHAIINAAGPSGGPFVTINQNTSLDALTLGERVRLNVNNFNTLRISSPFTLDGAHLAAGPGTIEFLTGATFSSGSLTIAGRMLNPGGAISLGSALVVLPVSSGTIGVVDQPFSNAARIVTGNSGQFGVRGSSIQNDGTFAVSQLGHQMYFTAAQHMLNNGTMSAGGQMFVNAGSFTNAGTLNVQTANFQITAPQGIINTGRINVTGGSLLLRGPLTNNGTLTVNAGVLGVGGTMNTDDVAQFNLAPDSSFAIVGTLNNAGRTLLLDAAHHRWIMSGGTLIGGAISTTPGRNFLASDGRLDGVTINGTVDFNGAGRLEVIGGLLGSGTVLTSGFGTLGSPNAPMVVGSGMTIKGGGVIGDKNQPFENNGTINTSGFATIIAGDGIVNHGVILGNAHFEGRYKRSDLGQLNGTQYGILGTLINDNTTFRVDATTPNWILGGTVQGGTLETGDGRIIPVPYYGIAPLSRTYNARLDNVVVNAALALGNAATLTIGNGSLVGNGSISISTPAIEGASRIVSATNTLMIGPGMTISGGGNFGFTQGSASGVGTGSNFGSNFVINHGTIRADGPQFAQQGLTGEFDLTAHNIVNDGKLQVGSTSFMFAADSNFGQPANTTLTFAPGGVLDIDLATDNTNGLLSVRGLLSLTTADDTLLLDTSAGVVPGTYYRIVTATDGIVGLFDTVSPNFELQFRNGNTELWARFVPEPGTASALGLIFAIRARRRRTP